MHTSHPTRLLWLDALRGNTVALVVVFHAAVCFMPAPPPWWYVKDAHPCLWLPAPIALLDVFMMPILFWVAGYSSAQNARRSTAAWLGARVRRLLGPWALGIAILVPIILWTAHASLGRPVQRWQDLYLLGGQLHSAHLWFLPVLFAFGALAQCAPRHLARLARLAQKRFFIVGFLLLECLSYTLLAQVLGPRTWWSGAFLAIQPARVGIYLGFFLLGAAEGQNPSPLRPRSIWAWGLATAPLALGYLTSISAPRAAPLYGPCFVLLAYAMLRVLSAVCHRTATNPLQTHVAHHAFGIYLLHMPLVVLVVWVLIPLPCPGNLKFLIASLAGGAGAWVLSKLLTWLKQFAATRLNALQADAVGS